MLKCSLITHKYLVITLKSAKYSEIYSVNINTKTLILSNVQLLENFGFVDYQTNTGLLLSSSNVNHISFCTREYIGSFYIVRYNSDTNILSIFTYGDKNKNIYQDTEIQLNANTNLNIPLSLSHTIKRIETASISDVLLGILLITNINEYLVFIQYQMCEKLDTKIFQLYTNENRVVLNSNLVPNTITDSQHSQIYILLL